MQSIDTETLKLLFPLCHLTDDELAILADRLVVEYAAKGSDVIKMGSTDPKALYLLKGIVQLTTKDERSLNIESGSAKARNPISHLVPHLYTVHALTDIAYIWIENHVLDNVVERQDQGGEHVENLFVKQDTIESPLFQDIYRDLLEDRLAIPAQPDIIDRIRRLVAEDADLNRIKSLVQTEPALTALLMKVANSAVFHNQRPAVTVKEAIQRIGINTLQNFVVSFALRHLFRSKYVYIKDQMQRLWRHSTQVAALSYVLAGKIKGFDPDYAMLLGLLHDIGMLPILRYAEKYPEIAANYPALQKAIHELHGEVGAVIMKKWNFAADFVTVVTAADDWHRNTTAHADYCDLVMIAQRLSFMGKDINYDTQPLDGRNLPLITDLPAYHKLGLDEFTAENGVEILHTAKDEINHALRLLAV